MTSRDGWGLNQPEDNPQPQHQVTEPNPINGIFGVDHARLAEGLELLRKRLCLYSGPTCDCKFGSSGKGEQTGCPELREAILFLRGHEDKVTRLDRIFDDNASTALAKIRRIVDRAVADNLLAVDESSNWPLCRDMGDQS